MPRTRILGGTHPVEDDFFALMASESPDALVLMTTQGHVLHWSKGAHATYGYRRDEAHGLSVMDLVVPLDQAAEQQLRLDEAVSNGSGTYESVRRRKDGSLLYVDVSTRLVHAPDGAARVARALLDLRLERRLVRVAVLAHVSPVLVAVVAVGDEPALSVAVHRRPGPSS